ncbi:MAG TPA: hypothetical protein VEA69_25205 [Tepidisphaeraceae bacterium]|nr:hypothetical protein [Tepidisphaeraceae bacterium]
MIEAITGAAVAIVLGVFVAFQVVASVLLILYSHSRHTISEQNKQLFEYGVEIQRLNRRVDEAERAACECTFELADDEDEGEDWRGN